MLLRLFVRLAVLVTVTADLVAARLRVAGAQRGQATVEYVALILLVAGVLAAAVAAAGKSGFDLGETVSGQLKKAINGVSGKSKV